MNVGALAKGFVVFPIAFIHISISMYHSSFTTSFVILPVAFIQTAIWPYHVPSTISHRCALDPLTLIHSFILQLRLLPSLSLVTVNIIIIIAKPAVLLSVLSHYIVRQILRFEEIIVPCLLIGQILCLSNCLSRSL